MELKVWVEGIQRVVCGVTESTTCQVSYVVTNFEEMVFVITTVESQDVVYALAHATGKTGRFTLIERWRNNERLLAPQDHPVTVNINYNCCFV